MTIIESIQYYLPELMQAMEETLIMMSISIFAAVLIGLPLGILLFISRENNNQGTILYQILNLLITVIRSFPYLLFVVAMIPVTRFLLGSSFGPIPASIPLSIVSIVIYARLVEQVLLDVPEDVGLLARSLGVSTYQYVKEFLLVEARSGLILSLTTTIVSMVSYSTVMGIVGGGGIGDFAIRYGYQRYEYGVMYFSILVMIVAVFSIQLIGNGLAKKLIKESRSRNEKGIFFGLVLAVMFLGACGTGNESQSEDKVIKVASQTTPMTDVVKVAADAVEDGWKIELVQVNDNIQYNELLNNKEVDANFAQHEPYMQRYNEEKSADLVALDKIYNAKVGFYSKEYTKIEDIPEGTKVALPNDVSNEGRALAILAEQGLIELKDGVGVNGTIKDITANPKNFEWLSVDLLNLAEAYNEPNVSLVYNYPTYIAKIGLKPDDALFLEKTIDDRFAISLVARKDNQDSEKINVLRKAMTSDKVKEFLENEHSDTLIPAF